MVTIYLRLHAGWLGTLGAPALVLHCAIRNRQLLQESLSINTSDGKIKYHLEAAFITVTWGEIDGRSPHMKAHLDI